MRRVTANFVGQSAVAIACNPSTVDFPQYIRQSFVHQIRFRTTCFYARLIVSGGVLFARHSPKALKIRQFPFSNKS